LPVAAVFGAATGNWLNAVWVPVKVIVVPFLLFAQIIGFTVYVHHVAPDIRWWTRRDWTQFKGQMESTTVVRFPRIVNGLWFHNIFVHVPHHVDTRIRFDHLPTAAAAIAGAYPGTVRSSRFSFRSYVRSTRRCKLYDFENGCWLSYRGARTCLGA
jgi:acyl-lipid omega-6 desaturase (Delta-12 desaturase)